MKKRRFEDIVELMAHLRAADGCPWDREQDHRTLRTYLLEETYEVLDAIERDDPRALQDELGDLLLQIVFHAQIAREAGRFEIADVLTGLHHKLVRRHPHIFGSASADTPEQVKQHWEALKAAERHAQEPATGEAGSYLDRVSKKAPPLHEAYQVTRRAAEIGFDWEKAEEVLTKLGEEVSELRRATAAGEARQIEDEVGDLLFVLANLARKLGVDPEAALRGSNGKFRRRFREMERELARRGKRLQDATLAEMDALWERAKEKEPRR